MQKQQGLEQIAPEPHPPPLRLTRGQRPVQQLQFQIGQFDVDRLPVAALAALPWQQLYNVLRVPLASTSSHVDFDLQHATPALLGERLNILLTLTSNEDKVGVCQTMLFSFVSLLSPTCRRC